MEHERETDESTLTATREELDTARVRLSSLRDDVGEIRERVSSAEALAQAAAGSAADAILEATRIAYIVEKYQGLP
ncbi:hypothetical protein LXL04_024769 [Taraxacum kok-saghyz]